MRTYSSPHFQIWPCWSRIVRLWRRSGPSRKDFLRLHDLFGRAGEIALIFSRPARDVDPDGVQTSGLHAQVELAVNFLDAV